MIKLLEVLSVHWIVIYLKWMLANHCANHFLLVNLYRTITTYIFTINISIIVVIIIVSVFLFILVIITITCSSVLLYHYHLVVLVGILLLLHSARLLLLSGNICPHDPAKMCACVCVCVCVC